MHCYEMNTHYQIFVILIFYLVDHNLGVRYGVQHQICTQNYNKDACQQVARDQEIACTEDTVSVVDCFLNLDQGFAQIAIVQPEEALLAAPLVSEKVVVIGEVFRDNSPLQTVVIVKKPYDGGFENLKGHSFCHPGFKHDELVTKFVLEELESRVINLNSSYCDIGESSTIVEKRIKAIANFFGQSCRPGRWSESDELDAKLKSTYSSLCELCGTEKCNVNYQTPFNDTLQCLTNGGDLAVTTLNDALIFFNTSSNAEKFQYLCSNGSVSVTSCIWTSQLNRLIVTESESAGTMKTFIENKLPSYLSSFSTQSASSDNYLAALEKVLDLNRYDRINLVSVATPLKTYVEALRTIPSLTTSKQCDLSIKWCTVNDKEQEKCNWLQQAGLNTGLQPVIECVQSAYSDDPISCLNDINEGKADVAYTDVNYGYIALKKGLTVVAYPETDTRQVSSILIVVNANRTDIDIKSLSDLKGKSACFPEYGGKEWLAFIDTLKTKNVIENSCDYGRIFSEFVGSSCVPAANSNDYGIQNTDSSKLCEQCIPINNTLPASYCSADDGNKYYTTDGALRCISELHGDYAVITKNDVTAYQPSEFRVVSKNGSLSQLTGFNVDENAPLTIITAGEVVAKASSSKKDDIILLLRAIELEFGQKLHKTFKVFESFNGTKDLLFPDSTPGLTFGGSTINYVENFKTLLSNSEKCVTANATSASALSAIPSAVLLLIFTYVTFRF